MVNFGEQIASNDLTCYLGIISMMLLLLQIVLTADTTRSSRIAMVKVNC